MAVALIQTAFVTGEVSPSLFGHVDLARLRSAASTMRNCFVSYRGGAYSRAGTRFVGFSKQTGRAYPPRLIPFEFSVNQGLALEFGNQYMRVISNGALVTIGSVPITGATKASPCVITSAAASGADTATPITTGVTASYLPGDTVTLAGGAYTHRAVLTVVTVHLVSLQINIPGSGYVPGDTITLAGGTTTTAPIVTVSKTQVVAAAVHAAGAGGTNGVQTVTGTTGTGTKFQAIVTVAGGALTAVNFISVAGAYTVNPTTIGAEPVTGAGLVGAQLSVTMGVQTFALTNPGVFTAVSPFGVFSQAATSGAGTGVLFRYGVFGPHAVTVSDPGSYTSFPANPVAQATSSGPGLGATFTLATKNVPQFVAGDWIFISGIVGMTELNGDIFYANPTSNTHTELLDVYGRNINSLAYSAYISGGTAAVIFTLPTPYAEADIKYLKYTQSADVMTLCCVNQDTQTEYAPQDLARIADNDWVFSDAVGVPTISPPANVTASASNTGSINYSYQVTAINPDDGTESVASPIASVIGAVDIAAQAGTITIVWTPVAGAEQYNIYKAIPGFNVTPPIGALFGLAGAAYGTQFSDSNVVPDFVQVPPTHKNPFARGQIIGAKPTAGGSGYTTVSLVIGTSTGSGAVLSGIIEGGALAAILVIDAGHGYDPADTVSVAGDGSGATAVLMVGAETGTYPSVPAYFQQRRAYANTLNNPDTYFFSQPGSYTNFDSRIPTIDTDAIIGNPWAVQVNGIQFMVPMPGGLVVFTGLGAWQLTGAGGSSLNPQPITPSSQSAQPQGYNGCSSTVPPIKIDAGIISVDAIDSLYWEFSYQIYGNIYTPADMTINSPHLFTGRTILEHAYCQRPYKIIWAVRDDGILLSDTYLKPQEVNGWARHDTNGLFQSVCTVIEPPVDALYLAVQRFIGTDTAYTIERMDDRIWVTDEDTWCVDCGARLPQPTPNAILTADSPVGLGALTGVTGLIGGSDYSTATTATVVDDNGKGSGSGAVASLAIVGGVITSVTFSPQGAGYTFPRLIINDPLGSGSGATADIVLDNSATFTASASVFGVGDVGKVIRMGGGVATVTAYHTGAEVVANITSPIVDTIPNTEKVRPQASGDWTLTAPVTTVGGLRYLAGAIVTGLADGNVIPDTLVPASGQITLGMAASAVTIGLRFQAQLQSVYLDAGAPTVQGQRKKIAAVTARIEGSRGIKCGTNQPDGSTQSPPQISPAWGSLADVPDNGPNFPPKPYNATSIPLRTGDVRLPVSGGFATPGQVAFQQDNPLPMQILAIIP